MNHNEREQFWQTLCSLPGNDIVAEREQLLKSMEKCQSAILNMYLMTRLEQEFQLQSLQRN